MPHTIKFFFSYIFLCGIFLNSTASTLKCDSLFAAGKYFEASIEYERLIFYASPGANLNLYRLQKALCYKQMHKFDRELEELQPIYFSNAGDTLYQRVCYEQSLCFYLNGDPEKALWKIEEYQHRNPDSTMHKLFMPVKILCLNETQKWEDAKKCFFSYIELSDFSAEKKIELHRMINDLYQKKNLPNIKSEKKAENWSRFIPGSGQIYSGKPGEGIVNFLINASLIAFTAQQAYQGFYVTGYLAGLGFFNKTYHGGIKRAGILTEHKSKEEMVNFNHQINQLIRSEFLSQ